MADIYTRMQGTAKRLLRPAAQGGFGQGQIVLSHSVPGTPSANPWDPVEPTTTTETLRGAVRGVSQKLVGTEVGGTVILASDRQAIVAVPVQDYTAGDTLAIDGVPVHIIVVEKIPAAGVTSAVKFIVRG